MRRGSRGRGYNRPPQRVQNTSSRQVSSGPTMNHLQLQGLKDIDMELELLKRKREIIEQQQQMLSDTYRQRNDYEQPMFNEPHDNRYDDYTRLYDNPRESDTYGGGGGGGRGGSTNRKRTHIAVWENEYSGGGRGGSSNRKRPHIPVWEDESPPKRFPAPSRGVKKAFGSRLGPPPKNSIPDYQPRPAAPKTFKRPAPSAPPQKRKEFNPTKVTKHSAGPPPMKLTNYEPAARKKLVTETLANSAAAVRTAPTTDPDAWTLRADREPSRQMVGRMELALGAIMINLKHDFPEYEELFKLPTASRAMKQAVRERIRTAMMGKVVSASETIKLAYYNMFPPSTGNDIVLKGLETQRGSEFITIESDDPEVFFKKNMYRLMSLKLEEMTKKLDEIYNKKNPSNPSKKKNKFYQSNAQDKPKADVVKTVDAQAKPDGPETEVDNIQPKKEDMPKADNMQSAADEGVQLKEGNAVQPKENEAQSKHDDSVVFVEGEDETVINLDDTENELAQTEEVDTKEEPIDFKYSSLISLEQYKAFDCLMNSKMIPLIRKYAPAFLKNMNIDTMYRKTKALIVNETSKKLLETLEEAPQTTNNDAPAKVTPEKRFQTPLQYYVKIIGKPYLPKRKAMEAFFEEFKPNSVKKHRTVYNLLFVGFAEKEPYERILGANGTVIGRYTLEIKVSERSENKNKSNNSVVSMDSSKATENSLNESASSECIGADLDEQISNLLTSIRQDESESFADDIDIDIPAKNVNKDDVKEENSEEAAKTESVVDCDATGGEDNDQKQDDSDVVEIKDVPKKNNDVVEIKDVPIKNDDVETSDIPITNDDVETSDIPITNDDVVETNDIPITNDDVVEINDIPTTNTDVIEIIDDSAEGDKEAKDSAENEEAEKQDRVQALKTDGIVKATPTRASARLATPSGIRTRRMSKLE